MLDSKISSMISAAQKEWLQERSSLELLINILADELGKGGRPCTRFKFPYADIDCKFKLKPGQCWKVFAHEKEKERMPGLRLSTLTP